jgi:hypothetical protein
MIKNTVILWFFALNHTLTVIVPYPPESDPFSDYNEALLWYDYTVTI